MLYVLPPFLFFLTFSSSFLFFFFSLSRVHLGCSHLRRENQKIRKSLRRCGHPRWTLVPMVSAYTIQLRLLATDEDTLFQSQEIRVFSRPITVNTSREIASLEQESDLMCCIGVNTCMPVSLFPVSTNLCMCSSSRFPNIPSSILG